MEQPFALLQLQGLLGVLEGLLVAPGVHRGHAPVVGVVGRLVALQARDAALVFLAPVIARTQLLRGTPVGVDALLRGRVAREQAAQPVLSWSLRQLHEGFLQSHRALRVIAGTRHVLHAVVIRFQFRLAAVARLDQRAADLRSLQREILVGAVRRRDAEYREADVEQRAGLLGLRAVACRGVHDLVAQHRGELRFVLELHQQAAVDRDLAPGQRPGVGRGIVQHHEFVGQLRALADARQALSHARHVGVQLGIEHVLAALALLAGSVLLLAGADLLLFRHEAHFRRAGDRVDAATAQSATQHQDGQRGTQWVEGIHWDRIAVWVESARFYRQSPHPHHPNIPEPQDRACC